jgi:iron(II)-dependent oxidoreductase
MFIAGPTMATWLRDARRHTLTLLSDLTDAQLMGPRLPILNPFLWEMGHVAWFQEKWVLRRQDGAPSVRPDADSLYDSAAVPHDVRWDLPLPSRAEILAYMRAVLEKVQERLARRELTPDDRYFMMLAVFHEDMHAEAFTYTRQTLGYPAPPTPPPVLGPRISNSAFSAGGPNPGDVRLPGGTFLLGAAPSEPFVFDNEKWAHPVELRPFSMARAPVTQAEFAHFVEDGGYRRPDWWDREAWAWRQQVGAGQPIYWKREAAGWLRRDFDRWVPLEPHRPVVHVNWYEAQAYCRWAGRRLPTEAEWEAAAAGPDKRRFPWGDAPEPSQERARVDGAGPGCVDVDRFPDGDSPAGCRQMIGNVWEWTADAFGPYPGFAPDPYKEYSQPWFGTHRVLRGGSWATRGRLLRNTWRNFYTPDRRDVWAGFRTCADNSKSEIPSSKSEGNPKARIENPKPEGNLKSEI